MIFKTLAFFVAAWVALSPLPCQAQTEETVSLVLKANEFYNESNYQQAAKLYEGLIDKGFQNGHLYYNLGNTHIRLGNTGKAILNYLHAQKFLPRDQDLQANLKYAVQNTVDLMDGHETNLLTTFLFWIDDFNLHEHILALTVINILFWLSMGVWLYNRTEAMNLMRKFMLVILTLAIISTMAKWRLDASHNFGVILDKQVDVKSGMDNNNVTLFQLHEGTIVTIEKVGADWLKIKLQDGKSGWAKKNSIGS